MLKHVESINESGLYLIDPKVYEDNRGYFYETFNEKDYAFLGVTNFVQDNESKSSKNVMRGLHYQCGKFAQAKLIRVISGKIIDFVLDIRKSSPTFGELFYFDISDENKMQLFIPRGFAHGFISLTDNVIFSYKCDNFYDKNSERGINLKDPDLNISKVIDMTDVILSEKDKVHPFLKDAVDLFE